MTKSEELFERFLTDNRLGFEKIAVDTTPRPDYRISIGDAWLVVEVKELAGDEKFGVVDDPSAPHVRSHSRTIGDHVRRRVQAAKSQIQYGAQKGMPSVLLVYNNLDPLQMFGTEDVDFTSAMYGELTSLIDWTSRRSSEIFHGRNQVLRDDRNTSFSAVGRLCDRTGAPSVTLFENVFAKVPLPFDQLPQCFDVRRVEISTDPVLLK